MIALYDGEISYTDKSIGFLMNKLDELGLEDKTFIIFTADHGESLVEHQYFFDHGEHLYESSIRVPLIFKYPGKLEPKRISSKVPIIDIMPTVLDMLSIKSKELLQGKSLLPFIHNKTKAKDLAIFSETYRADYKTDTMVLYKVSITKENWKLIYTILSENKYWSELYDLSKDSEELTNLAMVKKEKTKELLNSLNEYNLLGLNVKYSLDKIDKKTKERLKSLGYFQ